jgi:hypothetical protein
MAAYEKVYYDHCRSKASPPSQHGTSARLTRSEIRAAGSAALSS